MAKPHKCKGTDDDGKPLQPKRVTCGICNRSWCERCDPCPSALCPWCHGRGKSTAPLPKEKTAAPDPKVYLSASEGRYRVIVQGMPVTADKPTAAEAVTAAKSQGAKGISDLMWDGDLGTWKPLTV